MKLVMHIAISFVIFFNSSVYSHHDEAFNVSKVIKDKAEVIAEITPLIIEQGYIRETIPGTTISAAYLTLNNTSNKDITLIGITSEVSEHIELHNHEMNNGLMQMRQVNHIVIPANEQVVLQPSGLHIMIFNLEKGLKSNEKVNVNLQFLHAKSKEIVLPVRSIKAQHH